MTGKICMNTVHMHGADMMHQYRPGLYCRTRISEYSF